MTGRLSSVVSTSNLATRVAKVKKYQRFVSGTDHFLPFTVEALGGCTEALPDGRGVVEMLARWALEKARVDTECARRMFRTRACRSPQTDCTTVTKDLTEDATAWHPSERPSCGLVQVS